MEVVGEAILSASVQSLFGMLTSPEILKFASKQQVDKELKKWESKLLQINAVLDDAEEKQVTNRAVEIWLTKLRDLAYDAEDILDECRTEAMQSKLKSAESQASTSTMQKILPSCCTSLKPAGVWRDVKIASKLREITGRLEVIVNDKKDLDLSTNAGRRSNKVNKRVPTTSLLQESKVYGREKDKEVLVELLMSSEPSDCSYSVIPIIGMGGVGKTTLAQHVYNDETLEFDCKAWVCVSDDFDIVKITKAILQHWGSCETDNLNVLQEQLKKILHGKRFLIVLDDVWNENYDFWTTLRSPFAAGAQGSKIIATTRSKVVSLQMGSVPGHALKELSYDDCLSLFAQHALGAENFDANPDLKKIGEEIILRCKGLPLAAKTLGGLLRGKQSIKEWEVILNSKIWEIPEEKSNILPALRLSYHYLPSHLKQCFAFCAIFPKDYEFDKNELVLLWMAEGFLQQRNESNRAEDLGHEYFNDLLSKSFFQHSSGNRSRYIMHDLISDLACFVSGGICFHLDDRMNGAESSPTVRHSTFTARRHDIWQRFNVFYKMKSLRTFCVLPRYTGNFLSRKVLDDLVPKLKCLRALSLSGYNLVELPDSIGALKHLRYLNLSWNPIKKLPGSLSELFYLQALRLQGCEKLVELPTDIGNLINLQYLDIQGTKSLQLMPLQISQLTNLCSLSKFIVGEGSGLAIGELAKLSHLQGQLLVKGLHNVSSAQDAKLANLKEKQGLCELALEWSPSFDDSRNERDELQVLNSLRPHQSLEKLSVISYGGTVFPPWVGNPSFTKMVELKLHNCHKITSLPSIRKLPVLRSLNINCMDKVKEVAGEASPSLETLIITNMPAWEQWSWSHSLDDNPTEKFPNLRELTLRNCPKLIGKLPRRLPSLKELEVEGCQEVVLRNVADLYAVTTLKICRVSGLQSLQGTLVQTLVALEDLKIIQCNELMHLWHDGNDLSELASLKRLDISRCKQLALLVEGEEGFLPCNLQVLSVETCPNLEKLPNGLQSLTSLGELKINDCPKLASFPEGAGLPFNLQRLQILKCDSLEFLPDRMMSGHNSNQCLLEKLVIYQCPSLKSFPEGKLPTKLKLLRIEDCENLESLPEGITYTDPWEMSHSKLEYLTLGQKSSILSFPTGEYPPSLKRLKIVHLNIQSLPFPRSLFHLTKLEIYDCHELESFPVGGVPLPNLIFLLLWDCEKLRCVANFIDNLTSLQSLSIWSCSNLVSFTASGLPPNLTSLSIGDCKNLRQPMSEWGLRSLTSLTSLDIGFESACTTDVDYFPDDGGLLLPTSLTELWIQNHKYLKSISRGIQHLTSLKYLGLSHFPKLQFLPKEGFPATLGYLRVRRCPLLTERCKKEDGDYWPIIARIPKFLFLNLYNHA